MKPRLCWSAERLHRFCEPESAFQRALLKNIIRQAGLDLRHPVLHCMGKNGLQAHNFHLVAAKEINQRILRAMGAWRATEKKTFRNEVTRLLLLITEDEYWSWIAWRRGQKAWDVIFDLSYGIHSCTLAFVLDWMGTALTDEESRAVVRNAELRSFAAFLKPFHDPRAVHRWWMKPKGTNWAGVCAGGAGLLALALHERLPQAREVLGKVEEALRHHMERMHADGGWVEGPGYWNFGHAYAYLYFLSHETAFGKPHPLLKTAAARNTLWFPVRFSPNGVATGFGDSVSFSVQPFHRLAAQRFRDRELIAELEQRLRKDTLSCSADLHKLPFVESLLACGEATRTSRRPRALVAKRYGIGWALLADHPTGPSIHVSIRGGSSPVPHGHQDLSSFEVVLGRKRILGNVRQQSYMDTSFGLRRYELYETSFHSKNVLLINGVGFQPPATVLPAPVSGAGLKGFVMTMGRAMGTIKNQIAKGGEQPMVRIYRRGFFLTAQKDFLVLDRVTADAGVRLEARMHTTEPVRRTEGGWDIGRRPAAAAVRVASNEDLVLLSATGCTNQPDAQADTVLRPMVRDLTRDALVATLVSANPLRSLHMDPQEKCWQVVLATGGRKRRVLCFSKDTLQPLT